MLETLTSGPWWLHPGLGVALLGMAVFWRGMTGERGGERGLIRRTTTALGRAEGWRLTLVGLTLTGLGLAWLWELRWLLFLSLGIGFVEIQEASMVIRAWKAGQRNTVSNQAGEPGHTFSAYAWKRIEWPDRS